MTTSDSLPEKERLRAEIAELEQRLADLKARFPAHTPRVVMIEEMEELEEQIQQRKKQYAAL